MFMKTIKTWLTTIAVLLCCNLKVLSFEVDGISYSFISGREGVGVSGRIDKYIGDIVIPETVIYEDSTYRVTFIDFGAFKDCTELTSVVLPENLIEILGDAFKNCPNLTSINIPNSVKTIGGLGGEVFYGCKKLSHIVIPEGMSTIRYRTFYGCENLSSITLPKSLTKLEVQAFDGCEKLKDVYFMGNIEDWVKIDISNLSPTSVPFVYCDNFYT